jgi:hypothetical protein
MLLKRLLGLCVILFMAALPVRAADGEPGSGTVAFQLGFYYQPDSGGKAGNPFLDEQLTVIEPVLFFDYQINERDAIWALFSYDYVSSASIDRLSKFPQQSGASGDYYFGLDVGWKRKLDERTTRGLFVSGSAEYDYISLGLGGDITREDAATGRSLKLGGSAFFDIVDVIRFNGEEEGSDQRITLSGSATWYQPLSPVMHASYGVSLTLQQGFLETPYNAVVIEDGSGPNPNLVGNAPGREVTEELPDIRLRLALYGEVRRLLNPNNALSLGGRVYADDWGIISLTLQPGYTFWLVPDKHRLELYVRLYTQTAANAYAERFTEEKKERTQDSDLGDFSSVGVGALWHYDMSRWTSVNLGFGYTIRTDDLDYMTVNSGIVRKF